MISKQTPLKPVIPFRQTSFLPQHPITTKVPRSQDEWVYLVHALTLTYFYFAIFCTISIYTTIDTHFFLRTLIKIIVKLRSFIIIWISEFGVFPCKCARYRVLTTFILCETLVEGIINYFVLVNIDVIKCLFLKSPRCSFEQSREHPQNNLFCANEIVRNIFLYVKSVHFRVCDIASAILGR